MAGRLRFGLGVGALPSGASSVRSCGVGSRVLHLRALFNCGTFGG